MRFVIDVDPDDTEGGRKELRIGPDEPIDGVAVTGDMAQRVLDGQAVVLCTLHGAMAVDIEDLPAVAAAYLDDESS